MALKNLSDRQIQEYLEKRHDLREPEAQFSAATQKEIARYKAIYQALKQEPPLALSQDFSKNVIARIKAQADGKSEFEWWAILLSVLGLIAGLGVTIYYSGSGLLASTQENFASSVKAVNMLRSLASGLHVNFGLLGAGLFMLAVVHAFDHWLSHSRHKLISFFR